MAQRQHLRQQSNFTFHSRWPSTTYQQPQSPNPTNPSPQQNSHFQIGSLQQQLQTFQKQHQQQHQNTTKKSFPSISKQELDRVFKYFKKYEPIYFSKVEVKNMSLKFKKDVFVKKYKEGYYFGQVLQVREDQRFTRKIKHCKGILVYDLFAKNTNSPKRIYQGEWNNDKKSGLGFQRFPDNSAYHGHYHANKPHGRGKFTNAQRQVYQGQWKDGIKQGKGFWQGLNGQTYMGEFKNGKPQGYGVFVAENGNRFQGEYRNALKHGEGIERFVNGDLYKGMFENGAPCGYGEYYWKNKSYFKGYFSNGLRTGQGLWKRAPGVSDKYQGQYQNDKKWGYGVFTWANGNIFKGNYQGDLRNGYGEMFWTDGSYYKGHWKAGVQDGKGQLFVVGQGLRIGNFENNRILHVQYEEPCEDHQNEENKRINTKISQKSLQRNLSKTSQISYKSKQSKYTSLDKRKPILSEIAKPQFSEKSKLKHIKSKASHNSLVIDSKDYKGRVFQQNETGMRSVPLKKLIQNTDSSRLFFKQKAEKTAEFRISQKAMSSHKYNTSLSQSRASKTIAPEKRRNRILHSSFYLHKFKKLKSPERELSDEQKYYNNTLNLSNPVKS